MFSEAPYRRELTTEDLERMNIPKRYWFAKFDQITSRGSSKNSDDSLQAMVRKYIDHLDQAMIEGAGLIVYGINGTGKTCASVVIAKEFRRRGRTVLFVEAADLKRMVVDKDYFDEDETYWDRARTVDVLILDDFGKGIVDSTGFGAALFDELIRARSARKLVTIITANPPVSKWVEELDVKESTIHALKECTIPVRAIGKNRREAEAVKLKELLAN